MPTALPPSALRPSHVLFVFLDGVGLGPPGPANPLAHLDLPAFRRLAGGVRWTSEAPPHHAPRHTFRPLDATLGVEGLPQSGTGQASLLSGVNAAALAGRHFGPYPPASSKPMLERQSVFARLRASGHPAERLAFANAFPERFFAHAEARRRWTVTTFCCRTAGVTLRTGADLRAGRALAADLTNVRWRAELDPTAPVIPEAEAARRLARLAASHAFTLFEHYLTDKAGHAQDAAAAAAVLTSLDRFFGALLDVLDDGTLLLVSSDHGNLEDLSVRTHTRHPVPLVALGPGAGAFASADDLTDVTPALVGLLAG